jgi:outer membrane protein
VDLSLKDLFLFMRLKITAALLICVLSQISTEAQQSWNLRSVVEYAMANNIGVKLAEVQTKSADLTYNQSRLSRYPNASFNASTSLNSGNNQDPVTFSRITQSFLNAGFQLQSSADIFNFYSKRSTIAGNEWEVMAAKANVDKLKNDIALTAANAYLQILLAMEQEKIAQVQVQQTTAQLTNTRKLVNAGSLPELNAVQLEAQLASDSVNVITARGNVTQALLTLKSYMNLDAAAAFEIDTPPVEMIPVERIADLQPDYVYSLALQNQPLQRYNELKLKAADHFKSAARASMYPTLSAFGSLSSSYISSKTPAYVPVLGSFNPTGAKVNIAGTDYDVLAPDVTYSQNGYNRSGPFGSQVSDNFRQSIGLNLSVPIFNGAALRTSYERSKLNITTLQLQKTQDDQKLKQDIYQAYNAAMIALEKFNAGRKTVEINEITYNYATKRFDVGMLSTFDLITTQNNLFRARLEYTINRFDYVFKMKVLEFYKGQGLKL